jgi:hypothetical protein
MSPIVDVPNVSTELGQKPHAISGFGIGAVALGLISLFLPFFAAVFLVPTALVCSLLALRNKSYGLGAVGLILSGIGAIALFNLSSSFSSGLGNSSSPATHNVIYQLRGTASLASVTIENESGGSEQHSVSVPWTKEFKAREGQFLYLSAQNQGWGVLEATIYVDGQPLQRAETTDQFGIASASGSVP